MPAIRHGIDADHGEYPSSEASCRRCQPSLANDPVAREEIEMRQNKFRGNVFVANLPNGTTDEQLAQLFDQYGIVLGAFLARDAATASTKGCGLVNIAPARAAEAAIAALNGSTVGGRRIEVRAAAPEMAITMPKPPRPARLSAPRNPDGETRAYTGEKTHFAARPAARPVTVEYRNRFKSFASTLTNR
jgi:RNA recognition motif-containing protein